MNLRAIKFGDLQQAAALLHEGFDKRSYRKWLSNLTAMYEHAIRLNRPSIGYISSNKDGDIGICLTIPLTRSIYETIPVKTSNIAAFYMKPKFVWMASLFLKRIMTDDAVNYTDITPSASMRKVNTLLGFTTSAIGLLVVPLAATAFRLSKGGKIRTYHSKQTHEFTDELTQTLTEHLALGCRVVTIERDGIKHPVILSPKKRGELRSARVILTKDRDLIIESIGSLARYLLLRGFVFLEMDVYRKPNLWESSLRKRSAPIQSIRPITNDVIDHTYTELVFVN